jgi:histidyl-tRNA synthetase
MKKTVATVKGTREFYPEQMAVRNYLYEKVRAASQSFGYQEWDGPFLETIDLYAAKSGEELVKKQSFVFEDRGGDLVTLRPELTPSLARMIAARQGELTYPVRWCRSVRSGATSSRKRDAPASSSSGTSTSLEFNPRKPMRS